MSLKQIMQKIEKIKSMLVRHAASGLGIGEFCFNEGISPTSLYNRQKIYNNTLKVGSLGPKSGQASLEENNISNSTNSSELISGTARNQIKKQETLF